MKYLYNWTNFTHLFQLLSPWIISWTYSLLLELHHWSLNSLLNFACPILLHLDLPSYFLVFETWTCCIILHAYFNVHCSLLTLLCLFNHGDLRVKIKVSWFHKDLERIFTTKYSVSTFEIWWSWPFLNYSFKLNKI